MVYPAKPWSSSNNTTPKTKKYITIFFIMLYAMNIRFYIILLYITIVLIFCHEHQAFYYLVLSVDVYLVKSQIRWPKRCALYILTMYLYC